MHLYLVLVSCSGYWVATEPNNSVHNNFSGPIARPVSGYGADGPHPVNTLAFQNSAYKNGLDPEIFFPGDISGPRPTIFFAHGYGGTKSAYYQGIIDFLVRKGYAVVFVPYPTQAGSVEERYDILWTGFKEAVTQFPQLIDTRKAGFAGHSFGGGASFAMAYKGFVTEGWGSEGRFIFSLAPWYAYQISAEQLSGYPGNTKLLMEVYADDEVNDHRIAIDLFNSVNVDDLEKDFVLVESDDVDGYRYRADHSLPVTFESRKRPLDAYDYYAVYRLLDALIDYSFNSSLSGKDTALGNGSAQQVTMPSCKGDTLASLRVTDHPRPAHDPDYYFFSCEHKRNPRISFCK